LKPKKSKSVSTERQPLPGRSIRERVLLALAANRTPGFHFPGYFLGLTWPRIGSRTITQAMKAGPHCLDHRGGIDLPALGVMVDSALATAPRLVIQKGARQATVSLNLQFTGHPAARALDMRCAFEGFSAGGSVPQALASGVLKSGGNIVCHASGTFVVLPPPPGVRLAPLPWQRPPDAHLEPLREDELDAAERKVLAACDRALATADGEHSFIERFWGMLPVRTRDGARCRVPIGPHIGNRVGHVQGGLLLGFAAATARAAVPGHPMIANVSSWYISPGEGKALSVRSTVLHAGKSFAVVRTEIRKAGGARVLETVSSHAARPRD
jgi:acyl-coenzyme A thioesterase PaaI-like protein